MADASKRKDAEAAAAVAGAPQQAPTVGGSGGSGNGRQSATGRVSTLRVFNNDDLTVRDLAERLYKEHLERKRDAGGAGEEDEDEDDSGSSDDDEAGEGGATLHSIVQLLRRVCMTPQEKRQSEKEELQRKA